MKRLFWLIALLIIAIPAAAQDSDVSTNNMLPGAVDVTKVTLTRSEDNALSLTIYGIPVSCAPVVVEQSRHTYSFHDAESGAPSGEGTLIDVQLSTDPAPAGTVCNFIAPFSQTVELEGSFETDQSYLLTINNFTAWVYLVRPGQVVMDLELQQVDVGETELMGWLNSGTSIANVDWAVAAERYVATITGTLADGCMGDLMSYTSQDKVNPNLYHVKVFRILPLAVACPAILLDFTATVETDIPVTEEVALEVGNLLFWNRPLDNAFELTSVMQHPIVVESVNISGTEGSYQVRVSGTQNGDCGAPLQAVAGDNGAVSVIAVFDLVPETAPCTDNLIPYENTFTVSQMPVVVNGEVHFADDSNVPEEGDTMQVDSVIETVEVMVLESFPMQLNLNVTGYHPDGCDYPVQVDQQRQDNTVTVHIYREVPADVMCPMMIVGYEDSIRLEGGFTGGTVTIHVNDQTVTVDL